MKKCPYCAETIKAEAIVCRYCGRDLSPASISTPPQVLGKAEGSGQIAVGVPSRSSRAVSSLVFGIIAWILLPVIGAIAAIVEGNKAKQEVAASGGGLTGEKLATAGTILGYLNLVTYGALIAWILVMGFAGPNLRSAVLGPSTPTPTFSPLVQYDVVSMTCTDSIDAMRRDGFPLLDGAEGFHMVRSGTEAHTFNYGINCTPGHRPVIVFGYTQTGADNDSYMTQLGRFLVAAGLSSADIDQIQAWGESNSVRFALANGGQGVLGRYHVQIFLPGDSITYWIYLQ